MSFKTFYTTAFTLLVVISTIQAQDCQNWSSLPNKGELENKHMFYRDAVKAEDFAKAYPLWEELYKIAPAADGKRALHYSDGRKIIKGIYGAEEDATKQEALLAKFIKLYDEEYACYPKDKKGKDKKAYLLENKAYELYYTFNHDRDVIFKTLEEAREKAGKGFGYSALYPYADIACNFFIEKKIDANKAREINQYIQDVCDHNMTAQPAYKAHYQQQKDLATKRFEQIAGQIFGCEYHADKLKAKYDANPNDKANYTAIYEELGSYGCTNSNALMKEIDAKVQRDYQSALAEHKAETAAIAAEKAKKRQEQIATYQANNPAIMAQKAYKAGNYSEAVSKYKEAIAQETDASRKADYHYYLAVTYGRKLKQYSKAKSHIRQATSLDPSNGRPYLLLGDLYATSARSCGKNAFEQRMVILAAVKMWRKAKSVASDSQVQADASKKINTYSGQLPDKEMVFLNGKKVGQSYTVGCWIGETVTIKAK